ncbi:MAG: glycosyltransferase family 4 protein [Myxococcota bacterium]|nr:glycosyltransferase family 4 protein [Myxococcota bacterium]
MHILILSQYYAPEIGAAQTRLRATASCLKAEGHEVTVLTAMPNHLLESVMPAYRGKRYVEEEIDGIRVLRTWVYAATGRSWKRLANYFSFVASSALASAKVPPIDLVFFESPPLFLGLSAALLARKNRARLVMNVSDLWPDSVRAIAPDSAFSKGPLYAAAERLEAWLYKRCDAVTAVTHGIRDTLIEDKGLPAHKVAYLPNGIDPDLFQPRPPEERVQAPRRFLIAGTLGYAQGLDAAIDAARHLKGREDIEIHFLGGGPEKDRLRTAAAQEGLDRVIFRDPIPLDAMPNEYAQATAALALLADDPFFDRARPARSFPPLACGRPLIFAGRGDIAAMLREHACGTAVEPGDGRALADAIARYADQPDLAQADGERAANYAHAEITWPALVRRWLKEVNA